MEALKEAMFVVTIWYSLSNDWYDLARIWVTSNIEGIGDENGVAEQPLFNKARL